MKKACQISSLWLVSILYGACGTIENHHVVTGALAAPHQGRPAHAGLGSSAP